MKEASATTAEVRTIYHEKQSLMRCGLHSVNNMLQRRALDVHDFDAIARSLALPTESRWSFNPHQAVLGIGNYGVDVLTSALLLHGYTTTYFDRRKSCETIDLERLDGLLCNVPTSAMLGFWQSRHWFTIRQVDGVYYNLDSKLPAPVAFADAAGVLGYLSSLPPSDTTILLVTKGPPLDYSTSSS